MNTEISLGSKEVIRGYNNRITNALTCDDCVNINEHCTRLLDRLGTMFNIVTNAITQEENCLIKCGMERVASDIHHVMCGISEIEDIFMIDDVFSTQRKSPERHGQRKSIKPCRYSHAGDMTLDQVMTNLEKFNEDPIGLGCFVIAIGFAPNEKSTGGKCAENVDQLEADGVKFIRRGRNRFAISRTEQLHALEILKKAGYFKD